MYTVNRKNDAIIEEWSFILINFTLILEEYRLNEKIAESKRRYKSVKHYHRIYNRENNITEAEIPLPEDVKNEVLKQYVSQITVKKWSER